MKNREKLLLFLLFMGASALPVGSLDLVGSHGSAVEDKFYAPIVNPATLGLNNGIGLGYIYSRKSDENVNFTDHSGIINLPFFSYAFTASKYGDDTHRLAMGIPLFPKKLFFGVKHDWNIASQESNAWGVSLLYRPNRILSFSALFDELGSPGYYTDLGIGARPLFFTKNEDKLTLFYDSRVTSDNKFESLAAGLEAEIFEGVFINGGYSFLLENFKVGVAINFVPYVQGGGGVSSDGTVSGTDGYGSLFFSGQSLKSFYKDFYYIEYNQAQVITDAPTPFHREDTKTLYSFLQDIEKLKSDRSVSGIVFNNQAFFTSFSNLLEIEKALLSFKAAGKEIYFVYDDLNMSAYLLAAATNSTIVLNPAGTVNLKGLGSNFFYLKDFLGKYGIKVHAYKRDDYKSALNFLSEKEMVEAEREMMQALFDSFHEQVIRIIATRTGENFDKVRAIIGGGPYTAEEALKIGLVDTLAYSDQVPVEALLTSLFYDKTDYRWSETIGKVAVIYANGDILPGDGLEGLTIGSASLSRALKEARSDESIKAVVLRINSGGGSAVASEVIAREVELYRGVKPIVASMGGGAASGGYLIAAFADKVLATEATVTGSIGAVTLSLDLSGLMERLNIGVDSIVTEPNALYNSLLTAPTKEEDEKMMSMISHIYSRFLGSVGRGRDMTSDSVHQVGQGRLWTGKQALEHNLIDRIGGIQDAIDEASRLSGNAPGTLSVKEVNPGDRLFFLNLTNRFIKGNSSGRDILPEELNHLLDQYIRLSQFESDQPLLLMPYTFGF